MSSSNFFQPGLAIKASKQVSKEGSRKQAKEARKGKEASKQARNKEARNYGSKQADKRGNKEQGRKEQRKQGSKEHGNKQWKQGTNMLISTLCAHIWATSLIPHHDH